MLKRMCSTPACSQPAVSTVHQRPNWNTGSAPLAPSRNSTSVLGRQHRLDARAREQQREHVERDRAADDERHEAEVLAEPPQRRRVAPQPGIAAAAVVAGVVVDADQHAARRADDRAFGLPLGTRVILRYRQGARPAVQRCHRDPRACTNVRFAAPEVLLVPGDRSLERVDDVARSRAGRGLRAGSAASSVSTPTSCSAM